MSLAQKGIPLHFVLYPDIDQPSVYVFDSNLLVQTGMTTGKDRQLPNNVVAIQHRKPAHQIEAPPRYSQWKLGDAQTRNQPEYKDGDIGDYHRHSVNARYGDDM